MRNVYPYTSSTMIDCKLAFVIVGILLLIVAYIMHSGQASMQSYIPWLFAGSGAVLLCAGMKKYSGTTF
jgi:protein-S-isoprenylcysteine O-methyltransferase Ste14